MSATGADRTNGRGGYLLAALALAAILAGGFEPFYVRVLAANGERMRAAFTELPYRKLPGWRRLLVETDRRTPRGAKIAIILPFSAWESGYGYGYYRAAFLLPGKQLVPLLGPGAGRPAPEQLAMADYAVAWHAAPAIAGFEPLFSSTDGTVLRRVR